MVQVQLYSRLLTLNCVLGWRRRWTQLWRVRFGFSWPWCQELFIGQRAVRSFCVAPLSSDQTKRKLKDW